MTPGSILLALLLAAAPAAPASRPALTTRIEAPRRLTMGDPFDVVLTVRGAGPGRVIGPFAEGAPARDAGGSGVFAVAKQPERGAARGRAGESVYRLRLAAFRAGSQRLPVFLFLVRSGAGLDTLRSDTARVTVASVLPRDMKDIRDLKPPETFPDPLRWIVPLALLLAVGLAWAVRRLWRRLRRGAASGEPALPPGEQALAALDGMPWREWLAAGQVKRYYYALSEVLKRYIERRFEFNAVEQTTTEILASMRAHRTPMREEVREFLLRSDFVKYAKTVPPDEEMETAIARVRAFVERTRPEEAPAPPAAEPEAVAAGEGA